MSIVLVEKYNNRKKIEFDSIIDVIDYFYGLYLTNRATIKREIFRALKDPSKSYKGYRFFRLEDYENKLHLKKKSIKFQEYLKGKKSSTNLITIDDIASYYCKYYDKDHPDRVNKDLFKKLIIAYNQKVIEKVVSRDLTFKLPSRVGTVYVSKKLSDTKDRDFNLSDVLNTDVYFDEIYKYRLKLKLSSVFFSKKYYRFTSSKLFKTIFKKYISKVEYLIKK